MPWIELLRITIVAVLSTFPATMATRGLRRFAYFQFDTRVANWSLLILMEVAFYFALEAILDHAYLTLK